MRLLLAVLLFVTVVYAVDNGLGLLPPLGWNTWCTLGPCGRDYCDEAEILSVGDELVKNGMRDLGYVYVNMDDCWASYRDPEGYIHADPKRFPNGLKPIAQSLHAKGLKYGLYTDSGIYTCSSGERPYKIPGSYGHYQQDAKTYASWEMDFVKMDFCNTIVNGTQLQPEVTYANMSRALNASGRSIYFESCEWGTDDPWHWMRQFANHWRATGDHHDDWATTSSIIEQAANLQLYGGPGGWNYLDFIMTGGEGCPDFVPGQRCPGMKDHEYVTEFTIWVVAASPIIVATEIRNMSAIQKYVLLNKEVLAIHQDKLGKPGGRTAFWSSSECVGGECQIWTRILFDGSYFVVLYNSGKQDHSITLNFASVLGFINVPVYLRDVWNKKDLGVFTGNYTTSVQSHGVVALKAYFTV